MFYSMIVEYRDVLTEISAKKISINDPDAETVPERNIQLPLVPVIQGTFFVNDAILSLT